MTSPGNDAATLPWPPDRADADNTALVRTVGAGHTYGGGLRAVVAVRGVTCQVYRGDRIAVTGPSGSGKSSLLYLLAGLESPTAGSIEWPAFGSSPVGRPADAAMVYQGPSLIPSLDVAENVALPLVLAGESDVTSRERAALALQSLGIGALASKLPDELSGGQAQRVAVARVLATAPRLILADEPTGQLDHGTGAHVIDALLAAAEQIGAALIVSTHDPAIAARLHEQWHLVDGVIARTTTMGVRA